MAGEDGQHGTQNLKKPAEKNTAGDKKQDENTEDQIVLDTVSTSLDVLNDVKKNVEIDKEQEKKKYDDVGASHLHQTIEKTGGEGHGREMKDSQAKLLDTGPGGAAL